MKSAPLALLAILLAAPLAAQVEFRTDFVKASQDAVKANKRLFLYFAETPPADKPAPEDRFKAVWQDKLFAERLSQGYLAAKLDVSTNREVAARFGPVWAPMFVLLGEDQRELATVYRASFPQKPDTARRWLDGVDNYLRELEGFKERAAREPKSLSRQNDLASHHAQYDQYAKAAAVFEAFLKVASEKKDLAAAKCQLATVLAAEMEILPVRAERNEAAFRYYSECVDEFIALKDKRALDAAGLAAPLDDAGNKGEALRKLLFRAADAFAEDDYEGEIRIKAALVAARYRNYDTAETELRAMLDKPKYAQRKADISNALAMVELWRRRK